MGEAEQLLYTFPLVISIYMTGKQRRGKKWPGSSSFLKNWSEGMRFQAPHFLYLISFSSLLTFLVVVFEVSWVFVFLKTLWRYLALSRSLQAFTSMPQSECLSKMCMRCAEIEWIGNTLELSYLPHLLVNFEGEEGCGWITESFEILNKTM